MLAAAAWHAERGHEAAARRLLMRAADALADREDLLGFPLPPGLATSARAAAASSPLPAPPVSLPSL